jgi:hypothetical protein
MKDDETAEDLLQEPGPEGPGGQEAEGPGEAETGSPTQASDGTEAATTAGPAKAPPWVANPHALALVQRAAAAVDLDVESLANLMVEGGITAIPPSDGITGRYTLLDLGTRLWGTMQEQPRPARAQWFGGLTPTQQIAVVVTLREKGFATQVIAQDFHIPMMDVLRIWNEHADNLGAQVVGIRLNTIAGNLQVVAERAQQGAMEKKDWSSMWRIQKELTAVLQSIGIVDRAIHKVEVTHKFDEQKQAELNALLDLERKQFRRAEEVKLIEAEVVDDVPEIADDYDAE